MNKSVLQKFATEARTELKKRIENKAIKYGIKEDEIKKGQVESSDSIVVDGHILDKYQKEQRRKLIEKIEALNEEGSNGFDIVMEEVAYTWFNRLIALRFMEVNRYIKTRALSSEEGSTVPDIVTEALDITFRNIELDEDYIRQLKLSSDRDATQKLFKYMIISQCNELHKSLPFMFETISDYTELLFPDGLLDENSFVSKMTDTNYIPEEDWEEVEIIGWLYQYYIADEKDRVIKAKKKYKKEEIPYATQLFTPKWIVKYMVQNSLGRYWIESHPEDDELKKEWEFYLENPEKEPDFDEKISPYIKKELNVEDIKCFDPACGSGHILVYMFEVLYEIYSRVGYEEREIPRLIIENNLYGLDIDDRAYQLACFAVVMKGASYNRMLLRSIERDGIKLNIASIQETNKLNDTDIAYIAGERSGKNFDKTKKFVETFYNGKTYGSLIKIDEFDKEFFEERLEYIRNNPIENVVYNESKLKGVDELLDKLIRQAYVMIKTYEILITNPPYIGNKYLNTDLTSFINRNYSDVKSDIFSAFIVYSFSKVKEEGHLGFMTPFVWMFIKSYEELRSIIINKKSISTLIQLEYSAFKEATVPICTFTIRNNNRNNILGEYVKLSEFKGADIQPLKVIESIEDPNVEYRYLANGNDFKRIPGTPIAYWIGETMLQAYEEGRLLGDIVKPRSGQNTGDNNRFLRRWSEVNISKIAFGLSKDDLIHFKEKWVPYNKGGEYRKWYGNYEFIVNWEENGKEIKEYAVYRNNGKHWSRYIQNIDFLCREGITWSFITSAKFSMRYLPKGFICDYAGCAMYPDKDERLILLSLLNSNTASKYIEAINPTLNFQPGNVSSIPVVKISQENTDAINKITKENIEIAKRDWDSSETSWEFKKHNLLLFKKNNKLIDSFENWCEFNKNEFNKIKFNEEYINRIFIESYGLQNKLNPEVEEKDITISLADRESDIKSFISYAVGCMLGRYSLDQEGLVYAGGDFDSSKYTTFKADEDNIIPILDESYFEDDIVSRFIEFVKVTFGEEYLKENLEYIATTLDEKNGKSNPKDTIRKYFLTSFYKDHVQTYKKRPIYWLITSGKQKAFNALIYMHRYDKNTLSRIRTDYVQPLQNKLDVEKSRAEEDLSLAIKASEKTQIKRKITNLDKQIDELKKFEETLHDFADKQIEIDLDDGVVYNYDLFKGLLSKI